MNFHIVTERIPLLVYLRKRFSHLSRTKIKNLLESKRIIVNGNITSQFNYALKPGDRVRIGELRRKVRHARLDFPIIYEDDAVIVINKPAGLLTIATDKIRINTAYYQLTEYVRERDPKQKARIFIVHRIDRDASGLLVFAKTEKAKEKLQKNWDQFEKKYFAVIEGVPKKAEDKIESYLMESKFRRVYSTRKSDLAKFSVTHYKMLENYGSFSLLEVTLETGRKNQIRVHLSEMGHPIAGDKKYGSQKNPIKRLALHAYYLAFNHPVTGEKKIFKTDLPDAFLKIKQNTEKTKLNLLRE